MGMVVLLGWHTHTHSLIQIQFSFVPMQYNTALGFLFCGWGLIFLSYGENIFSGVLGGFSSAIGAITLIQYIFSINIGLDELFMEHYIQIKTSQPGRMAPNTALCFLLTGSALIINYKTSIKNNLSTITSINTLGAIISGLGLVALTGYLFDLESAYGWGELTRMAVHTSIGFIVLGGGLISYAMSNLEKQVSPHFPIFLAVGLLVVSISFWRVLNVEEHKNSENLMRLEVLNHKSFIKRSLDQSILALERLKFRWEDKLYLEKKQWAKDANRYVKDKEGLLAIEWVDKDYIVRWIAPLEGNETANNLDLSFEGNRKTALDAARSSRRVKITKLIKFVQGGLGFLSVSPIFKGEKFEGFIVGVFEVKQLLESFAEDYKLRGLTIQYYDLGKQSMGDGKIFRHKISQNWNIESEMYYRGIRFGVRFIVADNYFALDKTQYPKVVGLSGILMSVFLSLLVYFNQKTKFQSAKLAGEIEAKEKISKQLEESENYLSNIIHHMVDGLISMSDKGIILMVNPAVECMFGYPKVELIGKNISILMPEPDQCAHDQYIQNYLLTGKSKILGVGREVTGIKKDKSTFPLELAVNQVDTLKQLIFIGSLRDISTRKKIELELDQYRNHLEDLVGERNIELKKINAELERFTFTASHDLQEPLRKVIMYGDRLQDSCAEKLDENENDFIHRMQKASFRMQDLIQDLLAYSRLVNVDKNIENINLNELTQEVIDDLEVQISTSGGNVQLCNLPTIEADKIQMRQLFQNIIANGIKYKNPDSLPEIMINSISSENNLHTISFHDNGLGFDEKYKEKIFEPFQRLITDREISGSGMGLFIC
jgi:PAS domain S-box-containing protein